MSKPTTNRTLKSTHTNQPTKTNHSFFLLIFFLSWLTPTLCLFGQTQNRSTSGTQQQQMRTPWFTSNIDNSCLLPTLHYAPPIFHFTLTLLHHHLFLPLCLQLSNFRLPISSFFSVMVRLWRCRWFWWQKQLNHEKQQLSMVKKPLALASTAAYRIEDRFVSYRGMQMGLLEEPVSVFFVCWMWC